MKQWTHEQISFHLILVIILGRAQYIVGIYQTLEIAHKEPEGSRKHKEHSVGCLYYSFELFSFLFKFNCLNKII